MGKWWVLAIIVLPALAGAQGHAHWAPYVNVTHPISVANCSCQLGHFVGTHEHEYCGRWDRIQNEDDTWSWVCGLTLEWSHVHFQVTRCRHVRVDRWVTSSFGSVIVDGSEVLELTTSFGGGKAGGSSVAGNADTYPVDVGSNWAPVGALCASAKGAGVSVRPQGCGGTPGRLVVGEAPSPDDLASWGRRCCPIMARSRGAQSDNSRFRNFVTVAPECLR